MAEFRFNVNDRIKVKLTDRGRQILNEHITECDRLCCLSEHYIPDCYREDEDGYIHPQMWHFISIFGKYFANGAPLVIERNGIVINEEDLKEVKGNDEL